jgi:Trypsin-co-occurring domain 1
MQNVICYQIGDDDQTVIRFEVEATTAGEFLVSRAADGKEAQLAPRLENALDVVNKFGQRILDCVSSLKPHAAEVEFGVAFKGEAGAPLIARTISEGHVKITLKWKDPKPSDKDVR